MSTFKTLVVILVCLVAAPFLQHVWNWFVGRKQQKQEPQEFAADRKASDETGIDRGSRGRRPEYLEALDDWLEGKRVIVVERHQSIGKTERDDIAWWFKLVFFILFPLTVLSAAALIVEVERGGFPNNKRAICILSALFGGCIAALRSCLDRRAHGFEDEDGNVSPEPEVRKERFSEGMAWSFLGRPILSASVGLLLYFALEGKVSFPESWRNEMSESAERLAFYAGLAGLLAKTLLNIFLEAGKKIFRTE